MAKNKNRSKKEATIASAVVANNESNVDENGSAHVSENVTTAAEMNNPEGGNGKPPVEAGEVAEKVEGFSFDTEKPVEFIVNGKSYSGTHFEFESEEELSDRKRIVVEFYGKEIIK